MLHRTLRGLGRLLLRAGWLLVLAAMAAGLTVVDLRVGGDLDWTQIRQQPLTAQTLVLGGTAVGWILWCVLAYFTVVAPAIDRWLTRQPVHLPVPLYRTVSAVTGAVVLLTNAVTGRHQPAPPAPPDPTPGTTAPAVAATGSAQDTARDHPPAPTTTAAADIRAASTLPHSWGWLPWPAAGAALATIGLITAGRRHRYQPQPLATRPRPDTGPVLVLPGLAPDPDDTIDPLTLVESAGPVVGITGDGWLDLDQLPHRLALTGPGAADAARGLLAVTTTHHAAHHHTTAVTPTVLITATDVRTLLGDDPHLGRRLTTLPGIHVGTDLAALLDHLDQRPPTDPSTGPAGPAVRTLLMHLPPLDSHTRHRLDTVLARHDGAAAVLMHPTLATSARWHIGADGHIDPPNGPTPTTPQAPRRLAVLTPTAALTLVTNAHRAATPPTPAAPAPTPTIPADPPPDATLPGPGPDPGGSPSTPAPDWRKDDGLRQLHLRVLGTPTVTVPQADGTAREVRFPRSACLHLLAYLAVHRDGADADELKEALWPDVAGSSARGRFQTAISVLGTTLHTAAGVPVLHHTNPPERRRYWLNPDQISVDLWTVHNLLDIADAHPDHQQDLLHRAADQVGGTLAAGLTADWLHTPREQLTDQLTDLFHTLATAEPDHHAAIDLLHRAIRYVAPTTDHLYRDLMRRHAALGNPTDVHRTYQALLDRLAAQHTPPDPTTRHLLHHLTQPPTSDSNTTGRHPQ